MISKIERKQLIMQRAVSHGLIAAAMFLAPSKSEMKTKQRITSSRHSEAGIMLNAEEKAKLRADLVSYRTARDAAQWGKSRAHNTWLALV